MERNDTHTSRQSWDDHGFGSFALLVTVLLLVGVGADHVSAQGAEFDGLDMNLGTLPRLSYAKTRSISPENFTGEKGKAGMATEGTGARAARELGQGWKVSPSVRIQPGQTFVMADIKAAGAIQHIWMTPTGNNRLNIFRIYWDGEENPSVECPVGDFFACGMGQYRRSRRWRSASIPRADSTAIG